MVKTHGFPVPIFPNKPIQWIFALGWFLLGAKKELQLGVPAISEVVDFLKGDILLRRLQKQVVQGG